MLEGSKTYIVAAIIVAVSIVDMAIADIPNWEGAEMLSVGLGLAGLRRGMQTGA